MKWNPSTPPPIHKQHQQQQQQRYKQQQQQQQQHLKMTRTVGTPTLRANYNSGNSSSSSSSSNGSAGERRARGGAEQPQQSLRYYYHHQQQSANTSSSLGGADNSHSSSSGYARAVILVLLRLWWSVLSICLISQIWLQQDYHHVAELSVANGGSSSSNPGSSTTTTSTTSSSSTTSTNTLNQNQHAGASTNGISISTSAQLQQAQQDLMAEYHERMNSNNALLHHANTNFQAEPIGSSTTTTASATMPSNTVSRTTTATHSSTPTTEDSTDWIRTNGLQLVMMGDSIMRYQYLDLIYYLHTGQWFDQRNNIINNNIASEKSFSSWKRFFQYTNSLFDGKEACDCFRFEGGLIPAKVYENRYYYYNHHDDNDNDSRDQQHCNNVSVAFFNKFGKLPTHGHWLPHEIHSRYNNTINNNNMPSSSWQPLQEKNKTNVWQFSSWSDMIRLYIAKLDPKPQFFVFNAGLWTNHDLYNETILVQIKQALDEHNMIGIYKTTTPTRDEIRRFSSLSTVSQIPLPQQQQHAHDITACRIMHYCFNLSIPLFFANASSSSTTLRESDYWDNVHMNANINRRINQAFLQLLKEISSNNNHKIRTTGGTANQQA